MKNFVTIISIMNSIKTSNVYNSCMFGTNLYQILKNLTIENKFKI